MNCITFSPLPPQTNGNRNTKHVYRFITNCGPRRRCCFRDARWKSRGNVVSLLLPPRARANSSTWRTRPSNYRSAVFFFCYVRFCFQLARFIRLTRRFFLALDNDTFFFSFFLFFGLTLNGVKIIMIIITEEWIDVFCYRNNEERSWCRRYDRFWRTDESSQALQTGWRWTSSSDPQQGKILSPILRVPSCETSLVRS